MKDLIFILFSILACSACSDNLKKSKINQINSSKAISKIFGNENLAWVIEEDTVILNVKLIENFYAFKCKSGKRVFRKKKFRLYPLISKIEIKKANQIIHYNDALKKNNLLGVFSSIIVVNNEKYLFQEEIGKRFIESNDKREGIILKIMNKDPIMIESTKGEIYPNNYNNIIADYLNNNLIDSRYFDMEVINTHREISKKFDITFYPNYFYLNPITAKLEPIFLEKSLHIEKISLEQEMAKFEPFKKYLNYFTLADSNKLFLKNENSIIREKIIIPENFLVQLSEGQSINFIETGSIFSYSPFEINGTKEKLVRIYSSDSSGQGLHLIQGNGTSKVNYLEFINQSSFLDSNKNNRRILPSAFTVYGGKVSINHSIFKNLSSEDAVNLFRCKYDFLDSKIENTFSDALDADFSTGKINNSYFINCGNDGVDISGGFLSLTNCYFNNILDKAISAGEESVLNASNCRIENSDMGLISKDLSIADSKNNIFSNCEIAYCAFQKKGEFGPGKITVENDSLIDCSIAHLIETKSKLVINEESIPVFKDNVIDYLYGKKYGKATVK
ncbi:MAG: hypothetical protein ACJ0QN_02300 [Parvicellaceae bacterium]